MGYEPRFYRDRHDPHGLVGFEVVEAETDLHVFAARRLPGLARDLVVEARREIEGYLDTHPRFGESYTPVEVDGDAPDLVRRMAAASSAAGVGPMAAVAGAIAEHVARGLALESRDVIVENGGDLYLVGSHDRVVALWAGDEAPGSIGIRIAASSMPRAVCTSSGRIGHSTSFGQSDAATVLSADAALADAVATALGNRIRSAGDVEHAVAWARSIDGVCGAIVTIDGTVAAGGDVELVPVSGTISREP